MKEVRLKRVAGPFDQIPFENFIQSPIGLVPKAGSGKTRLIFHLSYDFPGQSQGKSVNHHTLKDQCTVHYPDIDFAVKQYLRLHEQGEQREDNKARSGRSVQDYRPTVVYAGRSDIQSAFRVVPLKRESWPWLIMMAEDPKMGKIKFFVDKCLPFGTSISCSHFQRISNGLKHIIEVKNNTTITNYLDDFLFLALMILRCNYLLNQFLMTCELIGFPIAYEKTEWACEILTFLGLLLNGRLYTLSIPMEKRSRATTLLRNMIDRTKVTVRDLQELCGYLNFIGRAIYPGRVFTRRMYSKYVGLVDTKSTSTMVARRYVAKPFHHVRLDKEFKNDSKIWLECLTNEHLEQVVNRQMVDFTTIRMAKQIKFFSDASAGFELGYGCILNKRWIFGHWQKDFIKSQKPSIEYLELFALCAGILTWQNEEELNNTRIEVHCDNQAVVSMVNNIASTCPNCMHLLRILVLNGLIHNRRVFARYIHTKKNILVDALSRIDLIRFRKFGPQMNEYPDRVHEDIWPITKIWKNIKK